MAEVVEFGCVSRGVGLGLGLGLRVNHFHHRSGSKDNNSRAPTQGIQIAQWCEGMGARSRNMPLGALSCLHTHQALTHTLQRVAPDTCIYISQFFAWVLDRYPEPQGLHASLWGGKHHSPQHHRPQPIAAAPGAGWAPPKCSVLLRVVKRKNKPADYHTVCCGGRMQCPETVLACGMITCLHAACYPSSMVNRVP
jgi:hypothetical protein